MSRTYRKHLSHSDRAKYGGHVEPELREKKRPMKTPKQKRVNDRAKLRKEHL